MISHLFQLKEVCLQLQDLRAISYFLSLCFSSATTKICGLFSVIHPSFIMLRGNVKKKWCKHSSASVLHLVGPLTPLPPTLSTLPPVPFLPTWSAPPSLPLSSPNLRPAPFPSFISIFFFFKANWAYLRSDKHSFTVAALLCSTPSFYPLACCPSNLSALSSFLRFFPISPAKMRCGVYRGECVHSLSPAPVWVLVVGNGSVMKRRALLCKHTLARDIGFCVCV